ncbi:MAG: prolipoprotein diacylglyceryl transferase [Betaproteobacteria bacterium]|nr:prolipoprotein diacylglyceryl transferase [Betaproteobacteria bacterium]
MKNNLIGKFLYAVTFCVVLPAALAFWAYAANAFLPPVPFESAPIGAFLLAAGMALMAAAILALRIHGRGLPMNGYPPPVYVARGPYRLMRHPIYVGFAAACAGAAIMSGSSGGFWLVLPVTIAGAVALVLGFERPDLRRRFGPLLDEHKPFFRIPDNTLAAPDIADRVSAFVLVIIPWVVLYTIIGWLGSRAETVNISLPFEQGWPVLVWTEIFYASAYVMVPLAALLAPTQAALREYLRAAIAAMIVCFPLYLLLPFTALPHAFEGSGFWADLLHLERTIDAPAGGNAFPSFHVLWALIAMAALAKRGGCWHWLAPVWAAAITLSCLTTGQHAIADLFAAALVYLTIRYRARFLRACMDAAGRLANSLRTWRIGSLRIFNHAVYSGSAAFVGALVAATFAGTDGLYAVAITGVGTLVGGALWAQFIEGSPTLLRPFGYFGAVLGGALSTFFAPLAGADTLVLLAAFAVASPVIMILGRLRCLVQGCCHGRPLDPGIDAALGLRVTNPSSRVCLMSSFGGRPIHATPLYAIAANFIMALILLQLWSLGARLTLILGLCLLLAGLARFVEEAYRGEPQTRIWKRLTEYQWYAIVFVIVGAAVTALPFPATPPPIAFTWHTVAAAAALGLLAAFAMSMDFPNSSRRFARLTG